MGNLSSKTLKCHYSLMIYCKTHVCHVPSVVNDLCSQIYTPLSTRQHTMAANEGVAKVIASFYRDDLGIVFLGLSYYFRPSIIPANFFWVFTLSSPGFLETFRLLPQISDDFPKTSERYRKCPQMFRRRLSTFKVILGTTTLACFNFVRTFRSYFKDDNFSVL